MAVQAAIHHSLLNELLAKTETERGHIEVYAITLKHDLKPSGFAPLPEGQIEALRVNHNGKDMFAFLNPMDDYARYSLIELTDAEPAHTLLRKITPEADALNRQQTIEHERLAKAEAARQLIVQEHKTRLEVLNQIAEHFGIEPLEKYSLRYQTPSSLAMDIMKIQGGKLDLSSLKKVEGVQDILSTEVLKGLRKLSYQAAFGHDISLKEDGSNIHVAILNLNGKVMSKATLPLVAGEEVCEIGCADGDTLNFTYIPRTISAIQQSEDDIEPVVFERGRPMQVEHSRFKNLYQSLDHVTLVPKDLEQYIDGHTVALGETERLEHLLRYQLTRSGVAQEVANMIKSKPKRDNDRSIGLSA
ncbi:hypothetical protein ACI2KR_09365 [Pseudomonas luteola]